MAEPKKKNPFAITLDEDAETLLTRTLVNEIRNGKRARSLHIDENGYLDFAWSLYEQQSQRGISRDTPRYGNADLTSPIGTENVDALSARTVKTTFVEPLWIVEGVGKSADKAQIVEQFMQWRQEEMRLQKVAKRVFTSAYVETGSIFEACEDVEKCTRVEVVKAEPLLAEDGTRALDPETGKPMPALDESGVPVPAVDPEVFVEVKRTYQSYQRRGAYTRRRSMKDFLFLPSHAEDDREVWGHATRFYPTLAELKRKQNAGVLTNVDLLGGHTQEREQRAEMDRQGITLEVSHEDDLVEKELWRVQFWMTVKGQYGCYVALVSEIHDCILSIQADWLQRWRTVYANPYPCPYSVYGYSMILTKLLTTIEEHTAWRNINADRATLKANAPILRRHGAQWDPTTQPFGVGQVIDVADARDLTMMTLDDVTVVAINKEQSCVTDAQRIIGMNDIAIGQVSTKARTLGENEMATRESFTRTDDPIGNIQEAMEELGDVIFAIEMQTLRDMEEGMAAPADVVEVVKQYSDPSFDGTFSAQMMDGQYRFKPRGSVESADPVRRLKTMVDGLGFLKQVAAVNPPLAARLQSKEFGEAMMQIYVTEWKPRDRQIFLQPLEPPMPPAMPPGAGPPGGAMPPGMPHGGGAPDFGGGAMIQRLLAEHGGVQ